LAGLTQAEDPNLLVGYNTSDDAGVYRINRDLALVVTADFITPPVNDPFLYGQIAAANAISDIYAMGGRPLLCLNLVCFPSQKLPPEDLHQIVRGAALKIEEAGALLAGGHTVEDNEPKFGLAVTGTVHPDRVWTNSGARPGDALILTKPLGSGVLFNANLKGWVSAKAMDACIATTAGLNQTAARVLSEFQVHAATDVTGFGLAGHGLEMARGSRVTIEIDIRSLPLMDEALEMYRRGMNTGVNPHNRRLTEKHTDFKARIPEWHRQIIYDPQTSGGLLAAVPEDQAAEIVKELEAGQVTGAGIIGRITALEADRYLVFC